MKVATASKCITVLEIDGVAGAAGAVRPPALPALDLVQDVHVSKRLPRYSCHESNVTDGAMVPVLKVDDVADRHSAVC